MAESDTPKSWEAYEKEIYAEVAYQQKRDEIASIIGSFVDHQDLPGNWPGTVRIANAIMKVINQ